MQSGKIPQSFTLLQIRRELPHCQRAKVTASLSNIVNPPDMHQRLLHAIVQTSDQPDICGRRATVQLEREARVWHSTDNPVAACQCYRTADIYRIAVIKTAGQCPQTSTRPLKAFLLSQCLTERAWGPPRSLPARALPTKVGTLHCRGKNPSAPNASEWMRSGYQ